MRPQQKGKSRIICTVLLSVLFVIFCTLAGVVHILRSVVAEDAVDNLVKEIDMSEVKVGAIDDLDDDTLTEAVLEYSKELTREPLTEDEVEDLLKEDFVTDFVSDKMNDYVKDLLHNTGDGVIEAKEIEKLLEKNRDEIEDITGCYLTDNDIQNIYNKIKKDLKKTALSDYRNDNSFSFAAVRSLMSYPFMIILILLAVVCVAAIAFLNSDRLVVLKYAGICLVITGFLDLLNGLIIGGSASRLNNSIALGRKFWRQLLAPARSAGIVMGIVAAVMGVICIVIYAVICNARKSKLSQ
jgi:hypothetical protein